MKILLFFISCISLLTTYKNFYETVMIVNLIRHGARTPSKIRPEFQKFFPSMEKGKLTSSGFRQMVLLGKVLRKKYLENKTPEFKNFFDLGKLKDQFLLISSPYPRAIESGLGYSLGLLPEYIYNIYDTTHRFTEENPVPPILKDKPEEFEQLSKDTYNFIIENRERDVVFHSRRCTFPEHIYKKEAKEKNYEYLSTEEKSLVYDFYREHFNETLSEIDVSQFTDKLARSLYTAVRCINFNSKENMINIPDSTHLILKKLFAHYLFLKRTDNEEITKITSSPFLEHLLHFFDHKTKNMQTKIDFYELGNFNYTDLKFVTYSGHDYNFVGLIKNLLDLNTILHYINNIETYEKLLIVPFASTLDFHLIKDSLGVFYVKIFLNGEELFEKMRSHRENGEIIYEKSKGIPYQQFKKLLKSRIFKDYHHCLHTKK